MRHALKIWIAGIVGSIRQSKVMEQKRLRKARSFAGVFKKKHQEGQPKPVAPKPRDMKPEQAKAIADSAYAKFWNLTEYRKNYFRKEARIANIAYGFLGGKAYDKIECNCCYIEPDWEGVEDVIAEYTSEEPQVWRQRYAEWLGEAKKFFNDNMLDATYRVKTGPKTVVEANVNAA